MCGAEPMGVPVAFGWPGWGAGIIDEISVPKATGRSTVSVPLPSALGEVIGMAVTQNRKWAM